MAHDILFGPGNRLLGGSIGDLSLYGGQSDPAIALRAAAEGDGDAVLSPSATGSAEAHGGDAQHAEAAATISPEAGDHGAVPATALAAAPGFALHAPDAPQTSVAAPGITAFDFASAGPAFYISPSHGSDAPLSIPDHDVDVGGPSIGDVPAPVTQGMDALAGTAGHIAAAPGLLSPIFDTAHDTLSTTLSATGDTLHGIAGSDPLGGVATLVSLVSVSDMFDLHPVSAPLADITGDSGLGILDTLVGEGGLTDSLLGGTHDGDHGNGLDHGLHLDHPLGL